MQTHERELARSFATADDAIPRLEAPEWEGASGGGVFCTHHILPLSKLSEAANSAVSGANVVSTRSNSLLGAASLALPALTACLLPFVSAALGTVCFTPLLPLRLTAPERFLSSRRKSDAM